MFSPAALFWPALWRLRALPFQQAQPLRAPVMTAVEVLQPRVSLWRSDQ
jgi:hypothetical protein